MRVAFVSLRTPHHESGGGAPSDEVVGATETGDPSAADEAETNAENEGETNPETEPDSAEESEAASTEEPTETADTVDTISVDEGARRLRRTAELLATRGHEVTICCAQWWDGDEPEFEQNDVVYRRVCENPSPGSFAMRLPFILRDLDPEIIHTRSEPPAGVIAARTAGMTLRVPVVADWWAEPQERPESLLNRGHRWAARLPELVFTPSQMAKTTVREYGADPEDVRVIPESIDMDLIRDTEPEGRADVVYARDLDEDANIETFLLALAELRDQDWRATVIGDGPARADAEEAAEDLRIDDRVEFLGDLSNEESVPILKGAHVFAQTARREAFPTEMLWALACGCVGIVEYQADSCAHELVEGSDRHSLVTSPQELADEIVAAADAEHRTVDETFAEYDHRAVLEEYLSCYREVMDDYGLL